jgi:ArsR family transcriptional regulator
LRALADGSRLRLLSLLIDEELTVAELAQITRLKQPRVSTHLARLREAGLVLDRRAGVAAYYRCPIDEWPPATRALWTTLSAQLDDGLLGEDGERRAQVLAQRQSGENWADSVAGDMERHYSPGRNFEAVLRATVHLLELGDVLDIASGDGALAELLAPHARSLSCVDLSPRVVEAARRRLASFPNVRLECADMHALPLADRQFDLVLLLQALPYSEQPAVVLGEARRLLRPGGRLLATTLDAHDHRGAVAPFGHRNLGFAEQELQQLARAAGFAEISVAAGGVESRPPHFRSWVLSARA